MADEFTFTEGTPGCVAYQLGSLVLDDATVDADGSTWTVEELAGWFDGPPVRTATLERASSSGETVTIDRINGRALVMTCTAFLAGGRAMGATAAFRAQRRLKGTVASGLGTPLTLLVSDPDLSLRARVRLVGNIRTQIVGENGMVRFQVPLLALDPRRYSQTLTTESLTTGVTTITVPGNLSTPATFTVTGAETNAVIQNQTIDSTPTLGWTGSIPGGQDLVIRTDTEGVTLNGVNARDDLTTAEWFELVPGSNQMAVFQDTTITYRAAYA